MVWKDLLNDAGVDPRFLKHGTDIYAGAKPLNDALDQQGIQGVHLVGASHSPDMWYPLSVDVRRRYTRAKNGHPTKGTYWFPAYNSTRRSKALEFIKRR